MLRIKLEREQADVAWRWHWLDLQSRELQYQIHQADQQYLKLRRGKQPVVPPVENGDMCSVRTSGMGALKKSRKLCRRAPTNLSGRIVEGAESHPLFSFPGMITLTSFTVCNCFSRTQGFSQVCIKLEGTCHS